MRRLLSRILLIAAFFSFSTSAALYIPFLHDVIRDAAAGYLSRSSGYTVTLGTIRGILPFYFTIEDIEVKELITVRRSVAIPSWPDICMGRIGLLYLGIEGAHTAHSEAEFSTKPFFEQLPTSKIALHAFSCNLNNLVYRGQIYWRPKRQYLSFKLASSSHYKSLSSIDISAHISRKEASGKIMLEFLPTEFLKAAKVSAELSTRHPEIISRFVEPLETRSQIPYATGTCALTLDSEKLHETYCDVAFDVTHDKVLLFKSERLENSFLGMMSTFNGALSLEKEKKRLAIDIPTLSCASQNFKNLTLASQWIVKDKGITGEIALHGTRNTLPLTFTSQFQSDLSNLFTLKNADLSMSSATVKGSLGCSLKPFLLHGKINGTSSSLNLASAFLKRTIQGKSRYQIRFKPNYDDSTQSIEAECELKDILTTRSNFEKIDLFLSAKGQIPDLSCDLLAKVSNGQFKHLAIESATVSASTALHDMLHTTPFHISTKGKIDKGAFDMQLGGQLSTKKLEVDHFELQLANSRAKLKAPFYLTEEALSPVHLSWNNGAECQLFADLEKNELSGGLTLKRVPLDFVHLAFPTFFASGTVSGEGSLFGTKLDPRLHLQLGSNSLLLSNKTYDTEEPIELSCQVDVQDLEAYVKAEFSTPKIQKPLALRLSLPLAVTEFPYSISFNKYQIARGSLQGQVDVAPLLAPLFSENEVIEGNIELDTHLSGTLLDPNLSGTILLQKGKFDFLKLGSHFANINLKATLDNRTVKIDSCTATDEKQGSISAEGQIQLSPENKFAFDFSLLTSQYEVIRRDFTSVTASLKARLKGDTERASLSGDALVTNAELDIGSNFATGLQPLEFRYINGDDEYAPQEVPNNFQFDLDLNVKLPKEKGHIYGRGVESLWHGEATIRGPVEALQVNGGIDATKGTFQFASKEFQLVNSSIAFSGDTFTQSRLNVSAVKDLSAIRATIFLRGSIAQPRFVFQSKPELPQKEVLSYILFSKPLTDVSPMEGVMLANAALTLKGSKTPFSIFDTFKNSLGIDQINIAKSDNQAVDPSYSLQVGKYISDKLLLRLSKDVATAANRVAVQAHVSKNLSLQAEVGDDQEGQMSVMWKHDY